jgi:metal-responsive CopG/Arc/MetJ family transcriptional regulator
MVTFTSSLPEDLMQALNQKADQLKMPKNKLIEKALRIYMEHLERAEYIKSYKKAGQDDEIMSIAEEGMEEYLKQLENE